LEISLASFNFLENVISPMKKALVALLIFTSLSSLSQSRHDELMAIMDTAITTAKNLSMYSGEVDWTVLVKEMSAKSENAETLNDLAPSLELMINTLRDHHAMFRRLEDYSTLASFTDHENSRNHDDREFAPEIWSITNDLDARFEHALLPDNIGYLKVMAVGGNVDGQAESERIRAAVQELHDQGVTQWIVDFRYNAGGNVNVMMNGLAPLFDTEEILSIQGGDGETHSTARIQNGSFWYFGMNAFPMTTEPILKNPKIAVLTSRWTWSSGEFVAVAFKGQDNTRQFGEYTGGYTTNNSWDVINNEIALAMSTGIFSDRNGRRYSKYVSPDEKIGFEVTDDPKSDKGILRAVEWLVE
jgi:carboxyl-terminal processing protease